MLPGLRRHYASLLLLLSLQCSTASANWSNPFSSFFPNYSDGFHAILRGECADQYKAYLTNKTAQPDMTPLQREFHMDSQTHAVAECMLGAMPELIKVKMSSSQVLLGLMPTLLSSMGVSPQETSMVAFVARRPLLATLAAWASPAVTIVRAAQYGSSVRDLPQRKVNWPRVVYGIDKPILILEYALLAASMANNIELCYRIGAQSIFAIIPNSEYLAMLWVLLGVTIHIFGGICMYQCAGVTKIKSNGLEPDPHRLNAIELVKTYSKKPFERKRCVTVSMLNPGIGFFATSWLTSVYSACYILFGTILFSSITFVSVNDAVRIVLRFMGSVVVSRIIVSYELAMMAEKVDIIEPKEEAEMEPGHITAST